MKCIKAQKGKRANKAGAKRTKRRWIHWLSCPEDKAAEKREKNERQEAMAKDRTIKCSQRQWKRKKRGKKEGKQRANIGGNPQEVDKEEGKTNRRRSGVSQLPKPKRAAAPIYFHLAHTHNNCFCLLCIPFKMAPSYREHIEKNHKKYKNN